MVELERDFNDLRTSVMSKTEEPDEMRTAIQYLRTVVRTLEDERDV